jgi:hypothetical protein
MKEKNNSKNTRDTGKTESIADLKKQTTSNNEVKKGYNEKNPVQPHGAFKPDNASKKN